MLSAPAHSIYKPYVYIDMIIYNLFFSNYTIILGFKSKNYMIDFTLYFKQGQKRQQICSKRGNDIEKEREKESV